MIWTRFADDVNRCNPSLTRGSFPSKKSRVEAHVLEWLNLIVRWFHVITGIAWIGTSFYFNWLDSHLAPPPSPRDGVGGELWMVHSGGFYRVEKFAVTPPTLPSVLHWFKWEAYATWISGFSLLALVYYFGARAQLLLSGTAPLSAGVTILIAIATLVVGWFVYDGLCLSPLGTRPTLFVIVGFFLATGVAFSLSHLMSGHAAYIHTGALLGTLMAGNVWRRIIPFQRQLVRAAESGGTPDANFGKRAKQRSLHNNYMTLPVVFIMLSSHFPSTYGHRFSWLILAGIALIGAGVRHFFNLKNKGKINVWIMPAATAALVALVIVTAPARKPPAAASLSEIVPFSEVQRIVHDRCLSCHSANPTNPTFPTAPNGVVFDTADAIQTQAERIHVRAVVTRTMPLANLTGMTEDERTLLETWIAQRARLR